LDTIQENRRPRLVRQHRAGA